MPKIPATIGTEARSGPVKRAMKIASTGEVIGTISQDRATTIAGRLGAGPAMIPISLTLNNAERGVRKTFSMAMVNDELFTPLLAYLSILNTLTSYERQNGVGTYVLKGSASIKNHGDIAFEDLFTGDQPSAGAAASVVAPINTMSPASTRGRKASCCALLKRWISSTNRIVLLP